jgi:hypothetical protein
MKKIFFFLLVLASGEAPAQDQEDSFADNNDDFDYGVVLKKENNTYTELYINNVNPHAVQYLVNNYEDAENIQWIIDESGTLAKFNEGEKRILLIYDNDGNIVSTRKSYPGKILDPPIADFVKKTAGKDYSLYLVTEIIKEEQVTYQVSLENKSKWKIMRIVGNKEKGFERSGDVQVIKKG